MLNKKAHMGFLIFRRQHDDSNLLINSPVLISSLIKNPDKQAIPLPDNMSCLIVSLNYANLLNNHQVYKPLHHQKLKITN